jgi:chromosomal replication initiator protein
VARWKRDETQPPERLRARGGGFGVTRAPWRRWVLPEQSLPWDTLLQTVRSHSPGLYRSWFEDLIPAELAGGQLHIHVPHAAHVGYLRDHCTQAFIQAAMAISGRLVAIRFRTPNDDATTPAGAPAAHGLSGTPFNPDYTFDQFVVGPSNRLAHAACHAVCTQPGTLYNPLFIHGPSGLGKTHLLQAICAELLGTAPRPVVTYVSCETFINDFVRAIETGRLHEFRRAARRTDLLAIDDVQFLANHESSQEELFHTFNALYQARRQLVLSADSPPSEIPTLEDRLVSRFNWGLVAQIDPPNREMRQAILQKKARLLGHDVPDRVLDFIASRVKSNIRLLEGALTKLISQTQMDGSPITIDTARRALDGLDGHLGRPLQITDILQAVCQHFGIRLTELVSRKRSRSIAYPRQIGMYLARKLTALSLEEIGSHFGGRDHSTVLHAERTVDDERVEDSDLAHTLAQLSHRLAPPPS